jgi:hypothetical protein
MANQSPDRRYVLEMLALATAASRFPGFSRWICAPQHAMESAAQPRPTTYTPRFFTPPEFEALDQITELIIPRDDGPGAPNGAHSAGVAEFIDFMAFSDTKIQQPLREGLRPFIQLTAKQQNQRLHAIDGSPFFLLIRRYTVMGYYTSRMGLEQLDYPGLKFYSASPGCPHTGDPEHKHLPPPKV